MVKMQVKTTNPTKEEMVEIRARDRACVYCRKEFDRTRYNDRDTIEHLNHKKNWDSVRSYRRENKPVSEIVAICCRECNSSRGSKPLLKWFASEYCLKKDITYQMVAQVVRNYIDKYEKHSSTTKD